MTTQPLIRPASDADVPQLVEFRSAMFRDMGWTDDARIEMLEPHYAAYVRDATQRGDFVAWIAEVDGRTAGGVGLLWERVPPTVRNITGKQAYILAMYVRPEFRRKGIAHQLIETAVTYARDNGAEVVSLHYSPAGKGLYEKLGFTVSPEMRLFTDPDAAKWSPSAPGHVAADDAD